jgi:hypothetical protein
MCLRFAFLLITRVTAWLRLSRRQEAWKTAEILILRHQLAVLQPHPVLARMWHESGRGLLRCAYRLEYRLSPMDQVGPA